LEDLRNRHQQGLLVSIDFLKELLELAKEVVKLERETPVEEEIDRGKAALTELFEQAKNGDTPIMVKRVVDDIDEIVRAVRFDGWQNTHAGEREVKIALRKTLFQATSCTRTRSCSSGRIGIFGSITDAARHRPPNNSTQRTADRAASDAGR